MANLRIPPLPVDHDEQPTVRELFNVDTVYEPDEAAQAELFEDDITQVPTDDAW
ncbi:MAG: hypothetical protein H6716_24625 [Polyangiaceae bacterium]|nr:hypothetical protein [Polyangiaceae bacterium]